MNDAKEISIETLTVRLDELRADLRAAQQAAEAAEAKAVEATIRGDSGAAGASRARLNRFRHAGNPLAWRSNPLQRLTSSSSDFVPDQIIIARS